MSRFKSRKLDTTLERQILTRMITSADFLKNIDNYIQPEYFTSPDVRIISEWVLDYFTQHEQAPGKNIQTIFQQKEIYMDEAESELCRLLLQKLSKTFEVADDDEHLYIQTETLKYCQKRELEITAGNIKHFLEQDDVTSAERELLGFRQVAERTLKSVDVFSETVVEKVFSEKKKGLFQLTGYLGQFLKEFHRERLFVFAGAYKRGKSFWLAEVAINAIMSNLKVAFFSLEMSEDDLLERIYRRVSGAASTTDVRRVPVVDCLLNQKGECVRAECPKQDPLFVDGNLPEYEQALVYRICTACRNLEDQNNSGAFIPTVWYEDTEYKTMTEGIAKNKASQFVHAFGNSCKLQTYPRFSANLNDIKRDLDLLQVVEDFIPDVIIVDYIDILKPEEEGVSGYLKEDQSWIALSQLASERKAAVFTGTQITSAGQTTKSITIEHTARWSGKSGHLDALYGINQTEEEKNKGIQRIGRLLDRHNKFSNAQCTVLSHLEVGAIHLDSFPTPTEEDNEG